MIYKFLRCKQSYFIFSTLDVWKYFLAASNRRLICSGAASVLWLYFRLLFGSYFKKDVQSSLYIVRVHLHGLSNSCP